jgi:hypothetical protein
VVKPLNKSVERAALEARLARCKELAEQYRTGETAEMLRDMTEELDERIRQLDKC